MYNIYISWIHPRGINCSSPDVPDPQDKGPSAGQTKATVLALCPHRFQECIQFCGPRINTRKSTGNGTNQRRHLSHDPTHILIKLREHRREQVQDQ